MYFPSANMFRPQKTAYVAPSLELDLDEVQKTFETNLFSIMRMVQTFSGLLIKSKGTIVNIGTYYPDMPFPFRGKSCVQKYFNIQLLIIWLTYSRPLIRHVRCNKRRPASLFKCSES